MNFETEGKLRRLTWGTPHWWQHRQHRYHLRPFGDYSTHPQKHLWWGLNCMLPEYHHKRLHFYHPPDPPCNPPHSRWKSVFSELVSQYQTFGWCWLKFRKVSSIRLHGKWSSFCLEFLNLKIYWRYPGVLLIIFFQFIVINLNLDLNAKILSNTKEKLKFALLELTLAFNQFEMLVQYISDLNQRASKKSWAQFLKHTRYNRTLYCLAPSWVSNKIVH